jgi:uncharacterized membrane protein
MIFLLVLAVATTVSLLLPTRSGPRRPRRAARLGLAAAMVVAGIAHWAAPTPFLQHLPPWAPVPEALILVSGGVEIALGAALLLGPPWRRRAGLALAAYLLAVFPANVYVAVAGIDVDGQPGGAYPWLRLPLQALFIAWALWSTDWDLARRGGSTSLSGAGSAGRPPSTVTRGNH